MAHVKIRAIEILAEQNTQKINIKIFELIRSRTAPAITRCSVDGLANVFRSKRVYLEVIVIRLWDLALLQGDRR